MEWEELRVKLSESSKLEHGRRPEYGYARITIDLGDPDYVGTDLPLTFSGDILTKILYTGTAKGTYFRLNDRHAQQIFPSELKRLTIPFTKIYFTNATAQSGKVFIFYLGSGLGASVQPTLRHFGDTLEKVEVKTGTALAAESAAVTLSETAVRIEVYADTHPLKIRTSWDGNNWNDQLTVLSDIRTVYPLRVKAFKVQRAGLNDVDYEVVGMY